jgi:hypothetical protein
MGLHLINKNSPPSTPKSIRGTDPNGQPYSLAWNSSVQPFQSFVAQVQAFQSKNGIEVMSAEEIEDRICQQLAKGHCTADTVGYRPAPARRPGCKSCGKW